MAGLTFYERYTKPWRLRNPEKVQEYTKRNYDKHKEKMLGATKAWRAKNPEKLIEYHAREKAKRQPGARAEYSRAWYASELGRARCLVARSRKRAEKDGLDFDLDVELVLERMQAGRCEATGVSFSTARRAVKKRNPFAPSIDRIAHGGPYTKENCRMVCCIFNYARSDFADADVEVMARGLIARLDGKMDKE